MPQFNDWSKGYQNSLGDVRTAAIKIAGLFGDKPDHRVVNEHINAMKEHYGTTDLKKQRAHNRHEDALGTYLSGDMENYPDARLRADHAVFNAKHDVLDLGPHELLSELPNYRGKEEFGNVRGIGKLKVKSVLNHARNAAFHQSRSSAPNDNHAIASSLHHNAAMTFALGLKGANEARDDANRASQRAFNIYRNQ